MKNPRVGNESPHRGEKKSCVTFLNNAPTIEISHPEVDQNRQKRHFLVIFGVKIDILSDFKSYRLFSERSYEKSEGRK